MNTRSQQRQMRGISRRCGLTAREFRPMKGRGSEEKPQSYKTTVRCLLTKEKGGYLGQYYSSGAPAERSTGWLLRRATMAVHGQPWHRRIP